MAGGTALGETPDERREREAREAAARAQASVVAGLEPIVPPPATPLPDLGPGPAPHADAAEAQAVGDRYRASGGQPGPSSETTHPVRHRSTSRPMPDAHVLRFDGPTSSPEAVLPTPSGPPPVAPSQRMGQVREAPQTAPQTAPQAAPPQASPRERLQAALMAKQGAAQAAPSAAAPTREPYDHTGVDVADAIRRPLHMVGNALRGIAGRAPTSFSSMGEAQRTEEREGNAAAMARQQAEAAARTAAGRERRADANLESQASDRIGRREDTQARTASLDDYRQRMTSLRERLDAGLISQRQATAEALRMRTERERDSTDPTSAASDSARNEYNQWRNGLPDRLRQSLGMNDTAGMSAAEIQRMQSAHVRAVGSRRDITRRGRSGGAPSAARAAARATRETPPAWWASTPGEWAAMSDTHRSMAIRNHAAQAGGSSAQGGIEISPGVRTSLALNTSQVNRIRQGLTSAAGSSANIRGLQSIGARYRGASSLGPQARAELTPRLTTARGMVADLGRTGVINANEVPTINAALPNSADLEQMSFGTFDARVRTWQSLIEENARAQLTVNGVDEAGVERALAMIRGRGGQRQAAPTAPPASSVEGEWLVLPSGTRRHFPAANVDAAIERGARRAEAN